MIESPGLVFLLIRPGRIGLAIAVFETVWSYRVLPPTYIGQEMPPRNCHVDQVPTERRASHRTFFAQLLLIVQLRPSLVSWIMNDPISIVRKRWFDATPSGKEGVTDRYVVFGESRKWLVEQLHLRHNGHVLDF